MKNTIMIFIFSTQLKPMLMCICSCPITAHKTTDYFTSYYKRRHLISLVSASGLQPAFAEQSSLLREPGHQWCPKHMKYECV